MDFLLIALLTLLNGVFAMSELALASSRKARLTAMAESGDKGAQSALVLLDNPTQGVDVGAKEDIYESIEELRFYKKEFLRLK